MVVGSDVRRLLDTCKICSSGIVNILERESERETEREGEREREKVREKQRERERDRERGDRVCGCV